jgi:predicted GNAT family acetyltransferase
VRIVAGLPYYARPAFRRRGLAAAVTAALAAEASRRGAATLFVSAQDDDVARLYSAIGFGPLATAATAEPAG